MVGIGNVLRPSLFGLHALLILEFTKELGQVLCAGGYRRRRVFSSEA